MALQHRVRSSFFGSPAFLAGSLLVVVAAACGTNSRSDGSGDNGSGNGSGDPSGFIDGGGDGPAEILDGALTIAPADQVLTLVQGQPLSVDYKVTFVPKNGTPTDVTDRAAFSEEGADYGGTLGAFNGATFRPSGDRVGKTNIVAHLDNLDAKTSLTLSTKQTIVAAGADPQSGSLFTGSETGSAPTFIYPADGVMVPPNLNELEFQFAPGSSDQTVFELKVSSPYLDLTVYFPCQSVGAGCAYKPDSAVWNLIASAGRDQDPITYRLRGTSASGGPIGRAADRTIAFARENITGGVYYWNAAAGQTKRYEFGVSGQTAETYLSNANAGSLVCVGCHVLSRDGRFIAVGLDFPGSVYKAFNVATRKEMFAQNGGSFFTFSPDGTQMMVSGGTNISWRNTANGTPIVDNLVPEGTMPDWSADGASVVYVKPGDPAVINQPGASKGALEVIKETGTTWGAPTELVPYQAPINNYYPTFSPDSAWVLFNRSPSGHNSFGDTDSQGNSSGVPDGQLWLVAAAGGPPRRLDAVKTATDSYDSWPKWHPTAQTYRGNKLMWFTFSSKRAYGLRTAEGANAQIWMAAFDPDKAAQGLDPSYPPFWLPFQEMTSGNHIAQWVTTVERQPCGDPGTCAAGEECSEGRCVPKLK